jgi:hypothetical protein
VENRNQGRPVPPANVDHATHAREVGGGSDHGVPVQRRLRHILIEDRRGVRVLGQVGKEGHAVGQVKGGLPRLHPLEQMAPRLPQPGRPRKHHHRPERARDIAAQQRGERGSGPRGAPRLA